MTPAPIATCAERQKEAMNEQQIIELLQAIVRNDETYFTHHQARRWDGKEPTEVGRGTIFLTPKEMAMRALRRMGAPIPDALAECKSD
jgi:hypothetical protein